MSFYNLNIVQNFCEPRAYVRMNEAGHETKCEGGLDNFRKGKWGRTRSYTYGDVHARSRPNSLQGASLAKPPSNRNTAPSGAAGVPSLFAAANAARSRRVGGLAGPEESTLAPLAENDHDHEANTSGSGMDSECVEESPCPPTGTHRYSTQMMKMKASHY
jgi:M-phase inducer tyrosine phosphatase